MNSGESSRLERLMYIRMNSPTDWMSPCTVLVEREFAATLPDDWRTDRFRGKRVLREAARSVLPRSVTERRKVGFRVPVTLVVVPVRVDPPHLPPAGRHQRMQKRRRLPVRGAEERSQKRLLDAQPVGQ